MRVMARSMAMGLAGLCIAGREARAEDAIPEPKRPIEIGTGPPDKWTYTLFNPTPRGLMREMSTDRPDTTESPYTVDAGHFQVELSFADLTYDRNNDDSETVHSVGVAPMLMKVGLLNNVDLQVGLDPYVYEETEDRSTGDGDTLEGFGDTIVRLKINLWGNDGGNTAFGLMPFIQFPTASDDLGSGNIEGGLIAPLAVALPAEFSLGVMAEIDIVRSVDDDRYVVDMVHSITVSRDLWRDLGGYVEFAGFANLHADEKYRGFLDAGLTYALTPDVQLDCGIRVGVTEAAEDIGVFAGISVRY
jgi:hypothetical protein